MFIKMTTITKHHFLHLLCTFARYYLYINNGSIETLLPELLCYFIYLTIINTYSFWRSGAWIGNMIQLYDWRFTRDNFGEPRFWYALIIPLKALGIGKYNLVFLTIAFSFLFLILVSSFCLKKIWPCPKTLISSMAKIVGISGWGN